MMLRALNLGHITIWYAGTCVGVIAAQLVSSSLWDRQNGTHMIWFPGAVILGALLMTPKVIWPALVASGYVGLVAAWGAAGKPFADVALLAIPAVIMLPATAWCLRRLCRGAPFLQDFRALLLFTMVAVIALPVVTVALMAFIRSYTSLGQVGLSGWINIAIAHALGYALYVPAWCSLRWRESTLRADGSVNVVSIVLIGLVTVLLGSAWYAYGGLQEYRPLLCLAPAPIVIAAILVAQMPGSSVSMFAIAVIAAHLTSHGHGPFTASTAQAATLALQVWLLLGSLSALVVAMVVEQRFTSRRSLLDAHTELRQLAGRLIATQEQERASLARDLHDDINQRLAAASMDLSLLRKRLPADLHEEVTLLQDRIVSLCDDVRQLSHQLHPSYLEYTGLRGALETLIRHPQGHAWPLVRIVADDTVDRLPPETALCFYRVAQEALGNAVRHADATQVTLHATVTTGVAMLQVFDDGRGFEVPSRLAARTGIGITSMNERAKLLGGSFEITSSPGKGAYLCIRIPMTPI